MTRNVRIEEEGALRPHGIKREIGAALPSPGVSAQSPASGHHASFSAGVHNFKIGSLRLPSQHSVVSETCSPSEVRQAGFVSILLPAWPKWSGAGEVQRQVDIWRAKSEVETGRPADPVAVVRDICLRFKKQGYIDHWLDEFRKAGLEV